MGVVDSTSVIILAAGKGTRLNQGQPSKVPKVLHQIGGRPMLAYILETLSQAGFKDIVIVVGYQADLVKKEFGNGYKYALQLEQKGTGQAVSCAENLVSKNSQNILVIQGDDSAFYKAETLVNLVKAHVNERAKVSLLTLKHPHPAELGRIIRNSNNRVVAIKEKEVLTEQEKMINEINTGTYCFDSKWLWKNIKNLKPSATGRGELILPDIIKMAVEQGEIVSDHVIKDSNEWIGVNTPEQLEYANQVMQKRRSQGLG